MIEQKIQEAICKEIEPLFDIWKEQAKWTDAEACVVYHKLFDSESQTMKLYCAYLLTRLTKVTNIIM